MDEVSAGKDTTAGHWELAGIHITKPFPTYPDGFPPQVMDTFATQTGRGWLGNYPASGTVIIDELGEEHLQTGKLIVYTSGDSVFQIAAHESIISNEELYKYFSFAFLLLMRSFGHFSNKTLPYIVVLNFQNRHIQGLKKKGETRVNTAKLPAKFCAESMRSAV